MASVLESAARKLAQKLISQEEYDSIVDCHALAEFEEEDGRNRLASEDDPTLRGSTLPYSPTVSARLRFLI